MRRRLTFVTVATTIAAVAWRRRRVTSGRPPVLRVVAVLFSLSLGNWVSDLWDNTAGAALDEVKKWVRHLLDSLTQWLDDAFRWVRNTFDDISRWVSDIADAIYKWAGDAFNGLVGWVRSAFDAVYRWVGDVVGTIERWAAAAIDGVVHWVEKGLAALADAIDAIGRWVVDNVFNPLEHAIEYVWHEVLEPGVRWLLNIIGTIKDWAESAVKWLVGLIGGVWEWVERIAKPLLAIVEKAWGWLVFAAEHPFTWWHELIDDAFRRAPQWLLRHVAAAASQHGDELEQVLADWLAS